MAKMPNDSEQCGKCSLNHKGYCVLDNPLELIVQKENINFN